MKRLNMILLLVLFFSCGVDVNAYSGISGAPENISEILSETNTADDGLIKSSEPSESIDQAVSSSTNPDEDSSGEDPQLEAPGDLSERYRDITWWELLSEEELIYYEELQKSYESDPNFIPDSNPPDPAVNSEYNKIKIRIPGFIVGVDADPDNFNKVNSFLFVPYQGACIHVPPPPSNQTVFVTLDSAFNSDPYTPYWLYGTIITEEGDNGIASFSYIMSGDKLERYEY